MYILSAARRVIHNLTLCLVLLLVPPSFVDAQSTAPQRRAPLRASETLTLSVLERAVHAGAPELAAEQRTLSAARVDAQQARLLGNPTLELAWSTIPLGTTNPRDLERPMANVPNYEGALSYTFPAGKRAPRRNRADALAQGAEQNLMFTARTLALELAEILGRLATATLRRDGIGSLVLGGQRAAQLAEARVAAKFGAPLDVDQLRVDVERTQQLLFAVDSDIQQALADCEQLVGVTCESFESAEGARAYLERWLGAPAYTMNDLHDRADLSALRAYERAARADVVLANAERLPDPTLRLGYVHDRFLVSGNQRNSVNVAVSVPLPLFDRGQVRRRGAELARKHFADEHARRVAVAQARIPTLQKRLALSRERCRRLGAEVLPKALDVLHSLEHAVENRLLPLTQVIQSRRIVSELFIEEAESCGDAYLAAVELVRENPSQGDAL